MLSNRLTRVFARVVLASYLTQLLAPVAQACDVLTHSPIDHLARDRLNGRNIHPVQRPIAKTPKLVAPPINEECARSEAEAYQYRLRLKTLNSNAERFQLKLSRKEKGSDGQFTRLHTAMVNKGKVSTSSSVAQDAKDDTLLNLFKYASFQNFSDNFAWNLSGFKIVVGRDGSVLLDQASTPLLSIYDLVLKTSGELLLQSLGVAELTLQSPKTQIRGTVVTNHLHIDHEVINEGRLQVHKVSGQGILTNHATLDIEGTTETPAVLGVRQVINKKKGPKEAKIEGSHLHITSENHSFLNREGAEFRVRENLTVDDSSHAKASFTNMGSTYLPGAVFNRTATNAGFWQAYDMTANEKPFINKSLGNLKILDQFTVTSELMNEGDISVKNLLNLEKGTNNGTIKGDNLVLDIERTFLNNGGMAVHSIVGAGSFTNHHTLTLKGCESKPSSIGVANFNNSIDPNHQSRPAQVRGQRVSIEPTNKNFTNNTRSEIFIDIFDAKTRPHGFSISFFKNHGHIKSNRFDVRQFFHSSRRLWENSGEIETDTINFVGNSPTFTNTATGVLKIGKWLSSSALFINRGEIQAPQITLSHGQNTGKIYGENLMLAIKESMVSTGEVAVREVSGEGRFINKGKLQFTGTSEETARISVKHFENGSDASSSNGTELSPSQISGSHITVTAENEKFITHDNSEIAASRLVFEKPIKKLSLKEQLALKKAKLSEEANKNALIEVEPEPNHLVINNTGPELPVANKLSLKEGLALKKAKLAEESRLNRNTSTSSLKTLGSVGHASSSIPFELSGNIHTDELVVYHPNVLNSGDIDTSSLSLPKHAAMKEKGLFHNAEKAVLHVKKPFQADVEVFQNDGEMVTQGKFSQLTGEFTNTGVWDHTGDVNLGETTLKNEEKGTINWKQGQWSYFHAGEGSSYSIANHGHWTLDQITSHKLPLINNYGQLHLKKGVLDFELLRNSGTLVLSQGQYCIDDFQNMDSSNKSGIVKFLEHDWTLTDEVANIPVFKKKEVEQTNVSAPTELPVKLSFKETLALKKKAKLEAETKPSHLSIKNFDAKGEIQSQKALAYDLEKLPEKIISEGDVLFSKRHRDGRTLSDLEKISANGKVSFHTKDITTTKDYEFGNIGHLDLYVDGVFTTHHSFKAPVITLDVEGSLVGGKDNGVMGTIAATGYDIVFRTELPQDGKPLPRKIYIEQQGKKLNYTVMTPDGRVVEETIDLTVDRILKKDNETDDLKTFRTPILKKIAKRGHIIPGYGSLTVTAHSVDGRFAKFYGAGPTHIKSTRGDILVGAAAQGIGTEENARYAMNVRNGAYIASGHTLELESPTNILIDYGETTSYLDQKIKANSLVRNTAGKISSSGRVFLEALQYMHTRGGINAHGYHQGPNAGPLGTFYDYLLSGPALLESMGGILFTVDQIKNVASHILSMGDILNFGNQIGPSNYIEEVYNIGSCNHRTILHGEWTNPPITFTSSGIHWPMSRVNHVLVKTAFPSPNQLNFSCIIGGAESIQINTGNAIISGSWNSRFIKVTTTGDMDIYQNRKTRRHIDPSRPLLVNQTKAIANQVTPNGFIKPNARHVLETEFPIGAPYKQKGKQIFLVRQDNEHLYKMPMNLGQIIDRLENLPSGFMGLSTQSTLSEWAGRVYIQGSKKKPLKALEGNKDKFYEETGKSHVTPEDLVENGHHSMVLWSLEQEENRIYRDMILYIAPEDINPSRGISGETGIFHARKNLILHGAALEFERDVSVTADEKLRLLTILKRIYTANGHYDVIDAETKVTSEKGKVTAIGETGFQMKGATLRSFLGLIAGSTHGNTDIEDVLLSHVERHVHEEDEGGLFGGTKTTYSSTEKTSAHASTLQSQSDNVMVVSGDKGKTRITGSHLKAFLALIFKGKEIETNASVCKHTTVTNTEIEKAFSSSSVSSRQESATINPTTLEGSVIIGDTEKATYRGTDFLADIFYDNTKDGAALEPTIAMLEYFQQMVSESAFAKSDVGCKGGYEVMHPCRLMVNKVIRTLPEGEMKLNSVLWDKNQTEIVGKFTESTYELKKWHSEWAIHEQLIPNEALVVVALGVALATQGWGASLISKLSSTMFGTVNVAATATTVATVGPAIKLSALGVAVANAGVSVVCSQIVTSGLRTGDIGQVAKGLVSPEFIRSLGISMLSAGLCQQIGAALDIDMNPSLKEVLTEGKVKPVFTDFLQSQALKSGVNMGLNVAIGGQSAREALITAARDVSLNSVAAWASYKVGDAGVLGEMTPDEQDLAHTGIGALFGVATHLDKPIEGALTGGLNAFAAARASKIMFGTREELKTQAEEELRQQGRPVTKETLQMAMNDILHQKTAISMLLSASATAIITRDPGLTSTGIAVATNVTENNCIPSMTKSVLSAEYQPDFIQKREGFWKDEYDDPDDLYYYMAREGEEKRRASTRYTFLAFDEDIKDTRKELRNPNLSILERMSLNSYRQSQTTMRNSLAIKEVLCTDIDFSKRLKTGIEEWSSKGLIYSVNKANEHDVSPWHQVYSTANAFMYNNINLAASLFPVTYGETVLTFAPITRTTPVVKVAQFLNPARFFQSIGRVGKTGNMNTSRYFHLDYSTPETAYSLRIDPYTGRGPMHIDPNLFHSPTPTVGGGATKVTDKIFSFIHNEQGAGRGLGKGRETVGTLDFSGGKSSISIPNGSIDVAIPGRVKSRINLRNGDGTGEKPGLEWAWRKHGSIEKKNKSQFTISKEELKITLQDKQVVPSPVGMIESSLKADPEKRLFVREVDTGRIIGNLRSKDGSVQPTKLITVITDYEGNLNSTYPGPFKHVFDKF